MSASNKIKRIFQKVKVSSAERVFYREIHRIADKLEPKMRQKFLRVIKGIQNDVDINALTSALTSNNPRRVVEVFRILDLENRFARLGDELQTAFNEAMRATVSISTPIIANTLTFDVINEDSVAFLRRTRFKLVAEITRTTEEGIRQIVIDAYEQGGHPYEQARKIRNLVGLTRRQAIAVDNYEKMLTAEGMKRSQVNKLVTAYRNRQLTARARNIARTETIRAANAGQQQVWQQAVKRGLLDPQTVRRIWIVTPDDRLCPICAPIPGMNPEGVKLNDSFDTPQGPVKEPPVHPQCRCAVAIGSF